MASPIGKASLGERAARYIGYFFVFWALVSTFDSVVVLIWYHISPIPWNASAVIEAVVAYGLLNYASRLKLSREGKPIPRGIDRILVLMLASAWLLVTVIIVGAINFVLLGAKFTGSVETAMLSDLLLFNGVLIGFAGVIIGQDVRDRESISGGLQGGPMRANMLRNRRWGVITMAFLLMGSFTSLVSIPYADAIPNAGLLFLPIQFTVMGIGLLISRMV